MPSDNRSHKGRYATYSCREVADFTVSRCALHCVKVAVMSDSEITLRHVLSHLQAMELRINGRVDGIQKRIGLVETNLGQQIDGIDQRLDELEIGDVVNRVGRLESHVGIAN